MVFASARCTDRYTLIGVDFLPHNLLYMNPHIHHFQETLKEFEQFKEDFFGLHIRGCDLLDRDGSQEKCAHIKTDIENRIKSFLLLRTLSYWKGEIKRLEGKKHPEDKEYGWCSLMCESRGVRKGDYRYKCLHNIALSSEIELLEKAVKWGEKQTNK